MAPPQEGYKSQSAGPILSHHKTEIAAARRESPFQGMERAAIQTSQGFYQSAPEYTKNLENDFQVVRHTYRYGVIEPKKKVEAGVKKNN